MLFTKKRNTPKVFKAIAKKKIFGLRKKITLKHFKKNQLFAIVQKYDKQFERSFYMFDAVSFKFLQKQKKYEVRTKNFFFFNVAKWSIFNYYNFNFFF